MNSVHFLGSLADVCLFLLRILPLGEVREYPISNKGCRSIRTVMGVTS